MATSRLCSIPGCGKPLERREWCNAHYRRWRRYGDPLGGGVAWGERQRYLREVVLPFEGDECLDWPYSHAGGYGLVHIAGKQLRVPRVVCEMAHGPAPSPKHEAAHSCNRGAFGCCNKRHLRWATSLENSDDQRKAGTVPKGSRHGMAKLDEEKVRQIFALIGTMPQKDIATKFGVSRPTITDIKKKRYWAWLD